jgi:putative AlgH/UPF0301 family transcriptional regulator
MRTVIYVTFAYQILVYIMEHVKMGPMGLHVRASLDTGDPHVIIRTTVNKIHVAVMATAQI